MPNGHALPPRPVAHHYASLLPLRQKPGDQRHAHEVGQACSLHLGHQVGPVDLDRARADAEIEGDDLVGVARHQPLQHLALATRQGRYPLGKLAAFRVAALLDALAPERDEDRIPPGFPLRRTSECARKAASDITCPAT